MADYPSYLIRTHTLFDGTEVTIRPIRPADARMEEEFVGKLSSDSRYFRFMAHVRELPSSKLHYLTVVDYDRHMALVATIQRDGKEEEIGVARYVLNPDNESCEFAVTVADDRQGTGLAGVLMADLMKAARARGLKTMEGFVLNSNSRMLKFARQLGFKAHREIGDAETVRVVRSL